MPNRRKFIKSSVMLASGAAFVSRYSQVYGEDSKISDHTYQLNEDDYWKGIRKQFPLTDERTFLNNGTIGPSPNPVLKAVQDKMNSLNAWGEYGGQEDSRKPIADLLNVSQEEISLTHNTTEGINIVASGLPLGKGDEIIMTSHEHAGNALPWLNQQKQRGVVIRVFNPGNTASENLNKINDLISDQTKVIAVPHITCTTGHRLPIEEISKLGRSKGVWIFIDGAHGPGTEALDLKGTDCDFYASCGHKWLLGPAGTGFLYIKRENLDLLKPHHIGAYSDVGWELSTTRQELSGYVDTAHRFDYGTQSAALSHGLKASVEFLNTIGSDRASEYIKGLATYLLNNLIEFDGKIEVLTPLDPDSRSTMVGFRVKGMDFREFGKIATENKFRIRLVPESGLNSIRISTHVYNNRGEIDRFVEMVKDMAIR